MCRFLMKMGSDHPDVCVLQLLTDRCQGPKYVFLAQEFRRCWCAQRPVTLAMELSLYEEGLDFHLVYRVYLPLAVVTLSVCTRHLASQIESLSNTILASACATSKNLPSTQLKQNWLRKLTNGRSLKELAVCTCVKAEQAFLPDAALTRYCTSHAAHALCWDPQSGYSPW